MREEEVRERCKQWGARALTGDRHDGMQFPHSNNALYAMLIFNIHFYYIGLKFE